jgi:hypothetical protein
MINKAFHVFKLVVRGGFEPPTFRFSGASTASLHVAGCGPIGDLAAETMGWLSPDVAWHLRALAPRLAPQSR